MVPLVAKRIEGEARLTELVLQPWQSPAPEPLGGSGEAQALQLVASSPFDQSLARFEHGPIAAADERLIAEIDDFMAVIERLIGISRKEPRSYLDRGGRR